MLTFLCIIMGVAFLLSTRSQGNPLAIFIGLPILGMAGYIFIGGALGVGQ